MLNTRAVGLGVEQKTALLFELPPRRALLQSACIGGRTSLLSHLVGFFTPLCTSEASLHLCELVSLRAMVFSSNLTGLYSGLQPCFVAPTTAMAPAKKTTAPFVAAPRS